MLRALYEREIAPDLIVGTSAGALNGAFVVSRPQTVETADALAHIWRELRRGEELRLSEGPVRTAVLASAAIPGVLPPVPFGDHDLMDGGVANNTPISHAIELGAKTLYVLPTGHACALEGPRLIVLPPPCPLTIQPIDFSHADELIDRSLADARDFLDAGGPERPPIRMRMHRHGSQPGPTAHHTPGASGLVPAR
jgi:NTE family protein